MSVMTEQPDTAVLPDVEEEPVPEVEPTEQPAPEDRIQIPEDPWSGHCPKCGLVGCVAGHY